MKILVFSVFLFLTLAVSAYWSSGFTATAANTTTNAAAATGPPTDGPSGTPTGTPLPVCSPIEVLFDQTDHTDNGATPSQDFETTYDAYDSAGVDDFMVGSGSSWTIRKVVVRGQYFAGPGPADSFNVTIAGVEFTGLDYTQNGDEFTIPLPTPVRLNTQIYSLSVQARMDYVPYGEWGWVNRAPQAFLFPANWGNPGGGFMIPQCVNFDRRGAVCGIDPNFPEQAFRLEGNQGFCSAPAASVSGTVTYGNAIPAATRFVSDVLVSGDGSTPVSTTTVFPDGGYLLSGFGDGSYMVTPSKTSGQNSITSFDAAKISQYVAGVAGFTANQLIVADVSANGSITSFDAGLVARYVVGSSVILTPPFGTAGTWIFNPVNRTYPSVTTDISGEDYSALLMGEVSGNWTNTGPRPVASRQSQAAAAGDSVADSRGGPERKAAVAAPRLVMPANGEIVVPVSVAGAADKGIIAYEFDLRYDPSVIQPQTNAVDLVGTVSSKLSVTVNADQAGLLRVAVYGPMPIDASGVLLNLRFTAVGAPGSVSPLAWERFMFNEDPVTMASDGQVELSDPALTD